MEVLISISGTVAESKGIDISRTHLSFVIDKDTGEKVINVIDNETGKVIRQIPADEILELKKRDVHES